MAGGAEGEGSHRYDAFISYRREDLAYAEALENRLTAAGLRVWLDRARLDSGCNWYEEIEAGLKASRVVLPVLTPRWKESEWTRFETYGAEAVLPLRFEGSWAEVMTPPLARFQGMAVDLREATEGSWERLVPAIRSLLEKPAPNKAERIAHLRYRANPHFVGREVELNRIHEALHRGPTAALTQGKVEAIAALGGVGKTTLAREYAERFWRVYPQVFWVDARDSGAGIVAEFARIAKLLLPQLSDEKDDPALAERALRALNGPDVQLLILDNAEDEESIQRWIPRQGGCRTIITSRFTAWSPGVETLRVFVLEPEPARELLLRRAGRDAAEENKAAADRLAERLGYLPLALEQAAAYVGEQGPEYGFEDYLRLYAEAESQLLAERALGSTEYPDSVITTWRATVAKVSPAARAVLRLSAFMSTEPIPVALFVSGAGTIRERSQAFGDTLAGKEEAKPDEYYVRSAVRDLSRYSMVTASGTTFTLHALVQAVERLDLSEEERPAWIEQVMVLLGDYLPRGSDDVRTWPVWEPMTPHVVRMLATARDIGDPKRLTVLMNDLGLHMLAKGTYEAGDLWLRRALVTHEASHAPHHPGVAEILNNLAALLGVTGQYEQARPLHERALRILEKALGPEHPEVATSLNNLALLLEETGHYEQARPLHERALRIRERVLGPEHPDVGVSLNNLAALHRATGQYGQAKQLLERALEIREKALGPEHPDVALNLHNLAVLLWATGQCEQARPLCERALRIRERVLGPEHPDVGVSLHSMTALLFAAGQYEQARPLMERALRILEKALGPEHPDVAQSLNNLAALHRATGQREQARPLYERAVRIKEQAFGSEHPDVAASLHNLGGLLRETGQHEQARPLHERALRIRERVLGPEHPDVGVSLHGLARLHQSANRFAEADPLYLRALMILSRVDVGGEHEHPHLQKVIEDYRALLAESGVSEQETDLKVQNALREEE